MTTITVPSDDLARALGSVIHAAGKDQARPILCAVHLHQSGETLRLAASDNYRAAWDDLGRAVDLLAGDLTGGLTIARDDAAALLADLRKLRMSADVIMTPSGDTPPVLTVAYAGTSRTLRLIDGVYPDYESVAAAAIGRESDVTIGLTGAYLAEVAKVFAPDKPGYNGSALSISNGSTVSISFDPTDPKHPIVIRPRVGSAVEVLMPMVLT